MTQLTDTPFTIAGRDFSSRLLVGTGKYKDFTETGAAIAQSGAEIVTFAVRRTNLGQDADAPTDRLIDILISRVRKKIEPNPKKPEIITTVVGGGYKFSARIE